LQDRRSSGTTFSKITGSGQIGRLGYRIFRARVFTAAEWIAFTAGIRAGEFD
jgi:hypothetical protein